MAHHANRLALAALITCGAAVPAWADPASSASSASSTASQSVGSISGSIQRSSNSSSGNTVAEGWGNLVAGRSGIDSITALVPASTSCTCSLS